MNGLLLLAVAGTFTLTSPAFTGGAAIPARFTCAGADVSPPLRGAARRRRREASS